MGMNSHEIDGSDGHQPQEAQSTPPQPVKVSRRRLAWIGAVIGTALATGTVGYFFGKNQPLQKTSESPLLLGVTGKFVNLEPGQIVSGDIFRFTIAQHIINGNQVNQLAATIWYAGALPDTSTNPKGGWVNADVEKVHITEDGEHELHINMQQPKPGEPPVPDGVFSLSINASGRRPDGKKGTTEGVPGPIHLVYQRRTGV